MQGFAYLISTFKEPERVVRLVKRLATKEDLFYIHLDKKIKEDKRLSWKSYIEKECSDINIEVASTTKVYWGAFGLTESTLKAMKYFNEFNYNYFINLSGDCYPLKSKEFIKKELKSKDTGFMTFWKMPYQNWYKGGMNRIQSSFYSIPYYKYPYVKFLELPRIRRRLPNNLEPYGGTNWFCLTKELVDYLVDYTDNNPEVPKFFKTVFAPAEVFFVTIMLNSPLKTKIVNDDKRLIKWGKGANPGIYITKNYEELLKSEKLFARKFDAKIDEKILDLLDEAANNDCRE